MKKNTNKKNTNKKKLNTKNRKKNKSNKTKHIKKYVGGARGPKNVENPIKISLSIYEKYGENLYVLQKKGELKPAHDYQVDKYYDYFYNYLPETKYENIVNNLGFKVSFSLKRMNIATGEVGPQYPVYLVRDTIDNPISLLIDISNDEEINKIPMEIRDHYPGIIFPKKERRILPLPPPASASSSRGASASKKAPSMNNMPEFATYLHNPQMQLVRFAEKIREIYNPGYQFSDWVVKEKWNDSHFKDTVVYYNVDDELNDVIKLTIQREPCNIAMVRHYNEPLLEKCFGWSYGAYALSTNVKLMPNLAIYCKSSLLKGNRIDYIDIDVINLIGYAFDSIEQPDYIYFRRKYGDGFFTNAAAKEELVVKYNNMWKLALACAINLKKTKFSIFNVGGGYFSGGFTNFKEDIFEKSFEPLIPIFARKKIEIIGYNKTTKQFDGSRFIPHIFDNPGEDDYKNTLYVNAWDPWSIIGNGNDHDNSLDGYWGKSTNMGVLGWFLTNPNMIFRPVLMYGKTELDKVNDISKEEIIDRASTIITSFNGDIINKHPLHRLHK